MLTLLDFAIGIVILIEDYLLFKAGEDHLKTLRGFATKKAFPVNILSVFCMYVLLSYLNSALEEQLS